jgi:hypothetical protein
MIIRPNISLARYESFEAILYEDGKKVQKIKGTRDKVQRGLREYFKLK